MVDQADAAAQICAGDPSEEDLLKIRTRKAEAPVLEVTMGDGSTRRVWCTFGPQQIDINPFSEPGTISCSGVTQCEAPAAAAPEWSSMQQILRRLAVSDGHSFMEALLA